MRPAALMRGAMRKATCVAVGMRALKPATSSSARSPGLRTLTQAVQAVLDDDAVLAGERHHVGNRPDRHQFQKRFGDRRTLSGGQPSVSIRPCTSLNATPTPQRFFSG